MVLEGRSKAERIALCVGAADHWMSPTARPGAENACFRCDVPFAVGPLTLVSVIDGAQHAHPLPGFRTGQVTRARLWLLLRFLWTLVILLPQIWRWKRGGDLGAREEVKEGLGLVLRPPAGRIDAQVLIPPDAAAHDLDHPKALTIVMPVYNAFEMVQEALDRVVRHTDLHWRLVLVEDASTDPQVRPWLREWTKGQGGAVILLENARNLGFVAAVNRGLTTALDHWPDDPVVLLNTDAMVPVGWASRLLAPMADPTIASVTPLSNDSEILTVPVLCMRHDLALGQGDVLDRMACDLGPGNPRPDLPTGVGFCMALAPRFLTLVPQFDNAFGRGYGEETDWCQKTRALGGRHVCAQNLFVEHRGGASFGSAAKQALLERSAAEIARRYPRYDAEVMAFVKSDPLTTPRLAMALSWAALSEDEVTVYLAHAMGGGAEHWLEQRIADHIGQGQAAVVLRVGQGVRWRLEVHGAQGITAGLSEDLAPMVTLVERLPRRRIIYSCGVGDPRAHELPAALVQLAGIDHPIEIMVHDFFMISPSFTLLGQDGTFAGVPVAGEPGAADDPAHRHRLPEGTDVDLAIWQREWGQLIAQAARVVAFSEDSRAHLIAAYPDSANRIVVRPHRIADNVPKIKRPKTDPVIGVLGNIGPQKGAGILQRLSEDLARTAAPKTRIVVLGHLAPEYRLKPPSLVHGAYRIEDLPGLVARYGITGWFIPSIWPETFSFTTHEALATGLPVVAFDLGAQGDAVRAASNGHVLTAPSGKASWVDVRRLIRCVQPGHLPDGLSPDKYGDA